MIDELLWTWLNQVYGLTPDQDEIYYHGDPNVTKTSKSCGPIIHSYDVDGIHYDVHEC